MNLKNKLILAPMAGVNNIAFRKLCTNYGADIVYSQMIDSIAFSRGNHKLADFFDEKNVVAQLFGNRPEILANTAKEIKSEVQAIDFNLGCPAADIITRECGSYLMKYPKKIALILKAILSKVNIPVTIKIRSGYDRKNQNAVKIAKLAEKLGIQAIAIHGRARTVNYQYPVDYNIIKKVKESVNIPVIGNGDIYTGNDAKQMFDKTGCDSIMVARGAIGNPVIFNEIKSYLKNKTFKGISKKEIFFKYLEYCKKYKIDFVDIKSHAQWLTKGLTEGGTYRQEMNQAHNIEDLKEIYNKIA